MRRLAVLFPLLLALTAKDAAAQAMDQEWEQTPAATETRQPDRKHPSIWRRPARRTPREQLAYARELEAAGEKGAAEKQFRALVHAWHDSPQAVEAQFAYARLLDDRGKYPKAFAEYQYMVRFFPGQFPFEEILRRQFAIANHYMRPSREGGASIESMRASTRAREFLDQIARNAPMWERTPEVYYRIGWIRERKHEYEEAVAAYAMILQQHADSDFAAAAALRRSHCLYVMSRRNPRDEESCRNALGALAAFISGYPAAPGMDQAQKERDELSAHLARMYFDRAAFYEKSRRPDAALKAYEYFVRQFAYSDLAGQAQERIQALKARQEARGEDH